MIGAFDMAYQQLLILFLQVTISHHLVSGACPWTASEAARQYSSCTRQFIAITDLTKGPLSFSAINSYCQTNATKEIECVETLINDCRGASETVKRRLDQMVHWNGIRNTVQILCENRQALASAKNCLSRYYDQVSQCIGAVLLSIVDIASRLEQQYGGAKLERETDKLICQAINQQKDCMIPYRFNCGEKVGEVFDALIDAATPAICSSARSNGDRGSSSGYCSPTNIVILVSVGLSALLTGKEFL